jgi:hypothetical protein
MSLRLIPRCDRKSFTFTLGAKDLAEFRDASRRIWDLIRDGNWHRAEAIELAAGGGEIRAREGLRRLRELRPIVARRGLSIECRRPGKGRDSEYRVRIETPEVRAAVSQGELF